MLIRSVLLSFAALSLSPAAMAATPILSGTYAFSATSPCQAKVTIVSENVMLAGDKTTGPAVKEIDTNTLGHIEETIGTAKFTPSTKTLVLNQIRIKGDALIVSPLGGNLLARSTLTQTLPYSNTATTVTVKGMVLDAVFSNIDSSGVAHRVDALRLDTANCAFHGTFVHQ